MPEHIKTIHDRRYQVLVERLRTARCAAEITQVELAAQLGAAQSYVSKYERAERRLDVIEVRAICKAIGLDFVDFIKSFEKALRRSGLS